MSEIPFFLRGFRVVHSVEKPRAWVDDFAGSAKLSGFAPAFMLFVERFLSPPVENHDAFEGIARGKGCEIRFIDERESSS